MSIAWLLCPIILLLLCPIILLLLSYYIVVIVVLLLKGSLEEKIFQRQVTKQGLNTVMDFNGGVAPNSGPNLLSNLSSPSKKKWEMSFSREELKDLFSLREDTLCDTHDLLSCRCGLHNNQPEGLTRHNEKVSDVCMYVCIYIYIQ